MCVHTSEEKIFVFILFFFRLLLSEIKLNASIVSHFIHVFFVHLGSSIRSNRHAWSAVGTNSQFPWHLNIRVHKIGGAPLLSVSFAQVTVKHVNLGCLPMFGPYMQGDLHHSQRPEAVRASTSHSPH